MGLIKVLLGDVWPYLAGAVVVVLGWIAGKRHGRTVEQSRQAQADLKGVENARKARSEIDALDDSSVIRRLGKWVRSR